MIGRQVGIDRRTGRAYATRRRLGGCRRRRGGGGHRRAFGLRRGLGLGRRLGRGRKLGRRLRSRFEGSLPLTRRFGCGGSVMHAAFDHRQPIDHVLDGAMDGFERILGAPFAAFDFGDVALDGGDGDGFGHRTGCRRSVAAADLIDMHEQIGEPALDGFEIAEPCIGRVEPLDQLGDAVLESAQRCVIGVGELNPFELLDQPGKKLLQLARHRVAGFGRGIERIGKRIDAAFQRRDGLRRSPRYWRDRPPWRRASARPRLLWSACRWRRRGRRCRASAPIAVSSCCSAAGSSLAMIRSTFCASVFTASSKPTRFSAGVKPRSASRTSESPRFEPGQHARIDAGFAGMIDALRQRVDLDFERFHGAARQRFGELLADIGEVLAKRP